MKLATLKQGGRDGTLVVVSRDLKRCVPVPSIARTLQALGLRRAMVVCGEVPVALPSGEGPAYLDELSTLGENTVAEFYQDRGFHTSRWSPSDFPLQKASLSDLAGGDAAENAAIIRRLLSGEDRGPHRDAVLLNAAAALMVAGHSRSMVEGWDRAAAVLDSGGGGDLLRRLAKGQ